MTAWTTFKQQLIDDGHLSNVFRDLPAQTWPVPASSRFEPLLIETQIERITELLDRSLGLRRDIRELEIVAVKSAAEYALFKKTSVLQQAEEEERLQEDARQAEEDGEAAAAEKFKAGQAPLDGGFAAQSGGRSASLGVEVEAIRRIKTKISARWKETNEHQDAYKARFDEPGNAHNYGERAGNLLQLLSQQMLEALERAAALSVGAATVYGLTAPKLGPEPYSMARLDEFAIWLMKLRQEIAVLKEGESAYDITVPLVQPWTGGDQGLVTKEAFIKALGGTDLTIVLTDKVFWGKKVRLKGIGVGFGNRFGIIPESGIDSVQTSDSFVRLAIEIDPPQQTYADRIARDRESIYFGAVGPHDARRPDAFVTGPAIENLEPFGKWTLRINPLMVWKDDGRYAVESGIKAEDRIRDLKVMFQFVVARKVKVK